MSIVRRQRRVSNSFGADYTLQYSRDMLMKRKIDS